MLPKFLLIVLVPSLSGYFLRKYRKYLKRSKVQTRWGPLYENVDTKHRRPVYFMSVFCARRFLLAVAIVFI